MNYIIYMSSAKQLMDTHELLEILTVSRKNNTAKNITGMLLYAEGTFVQVLEGDSNVLADTYQTIERDDRHRGIIKIASGELEQRVFPEWAMGFKSANKDELNEFEGYLLPSNQMLDSSEPHPALVILKTFVDSNRLTD